MLKCLWVEKQENNQLEQENKKGVVSYFDSFKVTKTTFNFIIQNHANNQSIRK